LTPDRGDTTFDAMPLSFSHDVGNDCSRSVSTWEELHCLTTAALKTLPAPTPRSKVTFTRSRAVGELLHWYKKGNWRPLSLAMHEEVQKRLAFGDRFCAVMRESLYDIEGASGPLIQIAAAPPRRHLVWLWLMGFLYTNSQRIKSCPEFSQN
jgi:hypothetical protein